MEYKRKVSVDSTEIVRDEQGRTISTTTSKKFTVKTQQDSFYMTYFENLSGFYKLTSATDIKLISILCSKAEYNTGIVDLSTKFRDEICDTLGILSTQISRSLKSLEMKDLIIRDKDRIEINPSCFWKGTNETRNKLLKEGGLELRVKFCYDCKN